MNKFYTIFLITMIVSGCACADIKNSARDQAGFYASNYPTMTLTEKADMLMKQFDNDRTPYSAKRKTYKVDCIFIYDYKGQQIFPDKGKEPKGKIIKTNIIKSRGY